MAATRTGRPFPPALLAGFLVSLNLVAMYGQAAWFRESITNHNGAEDWFIPVGVALVIEMIGVYLSGMAHAALMADQSAGLLRFGSYLIGGLVGFLNYWHFAGEGFAPTPAAVTFGALSAISPWLWSIYSRHLHRDRLAELGQVDRRGVKLSMSRKLWHPWKSLAVMSHAAWAGITEPDAAVASWEASRAERRRERVKVPATVGGPVPEVAREVTARVEPLRELPARQSGSVHEEETVATRAPATGQPIGDREVPAPRAARSNGQPTDEEIIAAYGEQLRAAGTPVPAGRVRAVCKVGSGRSERIAELINAG